jgi:hypothetical protein
MLFFRLLGSQWNMVLEIGVITIAGLMLGLILCVAQDIKNLIETK